jgi:sterol desaturase/sphingolipid hydroxylase (fatty acid hydroxylase superfamily)
LTIQNLPYIAAGAFLALSPWWIFWALLLKATIENDFMHLNMRVGNRWLERIIVTPRYHHIHHSDNPEHYNNNLAALFTIWDRLFGTYLDPEKVPRNLTFGIGESVPAVRLVVGL